MRNGVISIAGFDPSGGAGILADIKTFESHMVYGFGVVTAVTFQNEEVFDGVSWVSVEKIKNQINAIMSIHHINFAKIGLILNMHVLEQIVRFLKEINPNIAIVWDPILTTGSGYIIHREIDRKALYNVCQKIELITPNRPEMCRLIPDMTAEKGAAFLSRSCPVLLKGGHLEKEPVDILFDDAVSSEIYNGEQRQDKGKHGTGCVLSAAIVANLAHGESLPESCRKAKKYVTAFLNSNNDKLGYHLQNYHLMFAN